MDKLSLRQIAEKLTKESGQEWSPQRLWYVIHEKKYVPYREAVMIEKASDGQYKASVLCHDMKQIMKRIRAL